VSGPSAEGVSPLPAYDGDPPVLGEDVTRLDGIRRVLYGRLDRAGVRITDRIRGLVAVLVPAVAALLTQARDAGAAEERERAADAIADYVERQRCCGSPSACGAICQDSEEADAIARAAKPLAALIRTWKLVDRARGEL
jgi:hypothetical protein